MASCSEFAVPSALILAGGLLLKQNDPGTGLFVLGIVLASLGVVLMLLTAFVPDPAATLARMKSKQAQLMAGPAADPTTTAPAAQAQQQLDGDHAAGEPVMNRAQRRAAQRRRS